jgi:hypothetical protein
MRKLASWTPGLIIVGLASIATVTLLTAPTRSGLRKLQVEADELSAREADLLNRLITLNAITEDGVVLPQEALWSAGEAPSVEVALQQALVALAADAGLQLVSFAESPPVADTKLQTVANELELNGTHEGLARFLARIEAVRPPLAVSFLWLRQLPPDQSISGSPVSARLTVWGFREAEEIQ